MPPFDGSIAEGGVCPPTAPLSFVEPLPCSAFSCAPATVTGAAALSSNASAELAAPALAAIAAPTGHCLSESDEEFRLLATMAGVLNQVIQRNDDLQIACRRVSVFHSNIAPTISIRQYLERLHRYLNASFDAFVLAFIYVDRIMQRNPEFIISSFSIHRLLLTAALCASKFVDDVHDSNAYFSKVGGVTVQEMNGLEIEFLFMINFSLNVTPEDLKVYKDALVGIDPMDQESTCMPSISHVDLSKDDGRVDMETIVRQQAYTCAV
eukprot:tig00020675_g12675.t1